MIKSLLFLAFLFFFNCQPSHLPQNMNPTVPQPASLTYLALGDSYTIGESVPETDRWSMQLVELLKKDGISVASPDIIARTGWTTAELADAIQKSGNSKKYAMVSLLIGVNNQYRGQSIERYRTEFKDLLKTALNYADGKTEKVFVLSIPDWGVTPFAKGRNAEQIAKEIDAFNAVAASECKNAGIAFIDITPESRTAKNEASLVASDDLHFSGKMYKIWAEKAFPIAKTILKK